MTEPTPCPVCNELVAAERLQAHCDSHFPSQEEPADSQACSICNQRVRADDYDSHQYAHRRATLGVAQTLIPQSFASRSACWSSGTQHDLR
jgi:hypothetical protein